MIDIASLKVGDIIQNQGSGNAYTVTQVTPKVIATREIQVCNPTEWNLVARPGIFPSTLQSSFYAMRARTRGPGAHAEYRFPPDAPMSKD